MGFRFPDRISDSYHFVSNVAKRSGPDPSTTTQATQRLQQHEDIEAVAPSRATLTLALTRAQTQGVNYSRVYAQEIETWQRRFWRSLSRKGLKASPSSRTTTVS